MTATVAAPNYCQWPGLCLELRLPGGVHQHLPDRPADAGVHPLAGSDAQRVGEPVDRAVVGPRLAVHDGERPGGGEGPPAAAGQGVVRRGPAHPLPQHERLGRRPLRLGHGQLGHADDARGARVGHGPATRVVVTAPRRQRRAWWSR